MPKNYQQRKFTAIALIIALLVLLSILIHDVHAATNRGDIVVKPSGKTISLTFDDGPDPRYTPDILAILDKYNVKATFFVLGEFAEQYPEQMQAIRKHGHAIANHTWDHLKLPRLSFAKAKSEITRTTDIIEQTAGVRPTCVRPPYGMSNQKLRDFVQSQGMKMINWDLNSFDYKRKGVDALTNWVLSQSQPGYVILLHDGGGNRSQTVKALPGIIEGFQKKGYQFAPICESIPLKPTAATTPQAPIQ